MRIDTNNIREVGNYEILQHINPEGLSKTFKVRHKFTEEISALKVVFATDPNDIQRLEQTFKRLAKGMSQLSNPHLIKFKEYFVTEIEGSQCFVLVSEFFIGSELQSFVSKGKADALSYEDLTNVFRSICTAVDDAHRMRYMDEHDMEVEGFPHGHITPGNIMINNELVIKLLDFKLSNRYTFSEEKLSNRSLADEMSISKANDISQLGHLLYYLFAKEKNHKDYNLTDSGTDEIGTGIDKEKLGKHHKKVTSLIHACVNPESDSRITSVSELLQRLDGKMTLAKTNQPNGRRTIMAACLAALAIVVMSIPVLKTFVPEPEIAAESRGTIVKGGSADNGAAEIGEYYAYMVGNQSYVHMKPLAKPKQDVNRFIEILTTEYGFKPENIIKKFDASRDDIYDGFEQVQAKVKKNDNLLIFYAGHGQLDKETGYWIPVEGREHSRRDWISNNEIKNFLGSIVAKNVLVVSDACFGGSLLRSVTTYKSDTKNISNKKSRIALTSGSLESVPDNSVFIDQLFWYLENNQDSLIYTSNIFSGIREGIVANTSTDPGYGPIRDAGHQGGDFFFLRKWAETNPQ